MQEVIMIGKTTEEAVEKACEQLGLSRDEVSVEILEMPQRKLFGSSPAKVKVSPMEEALNVRELLGESAPQAKPEPVKTETAKPAPQKPKQAAPAPAPAAPELPEEPEEEIALDALDASAKNALEYLKGIARGIGAEQLTYSAVKTERGIKFVLDGDDASIVIGRRGETMDAIQYLCTLISSRSDEDYCKISLDVAGYRKKREKALIALAQREAAKVKKSRYSQTLEAMNPYERRIVHSAVQLIDGVKSESIGVEPNRRVVISLISGGKQGYDKRGRGGKGRGGDNKRGGKGGYRNDRRDSSSYDNKPVERTEAAKHADEYKPANDVPLYGRIDI